MLTITPRTFVNERFDTPEKRALVAGTSADERQRILESILVPYPTFRNAEKFIKRVHRPVQEGRHGRGQIAGLLGVSNAGKSFILENYVGEVGRDEIVDGAIIRRAIFVNCVQGCTALDLASGVYRALGFPAVPRLGVTALMDLTARIIAQPGSGVELVVIDDIQYLLCSSNKQYVRQTLGFIVGIAKAKTCNVVLGGTEDVHAAIRAFSHAFNQGHFPNHVVKPYDWNVRTERDNFLLLLDAIDQRLPFAKLSNLADPYIASTLYRVSKGAIGSVMLYVKAAAYEAINQGLSHITMANWETAAQDRANPDDPHRPFLDALDFENPLPSEAAEHREVSFRKSRSAV